MAAALGSAAALAAAAVALLLALVADVEAAEAEDEAADADVAALPALRTGHHAFDLVDKRVLFNLEVTRCGPQQKPQAHAQGGKDDDGKQNSHK